MMFYLVLLASIGVSTGAICPKQTHADVPKFTTELGNEDMVRLQNSIAILCCAEGYNNITWYRKEGPDWVTWPPEESGSSAAPTTEENNQILRINRAEMGDNTSFRCDLIKNGQVVKQHTMQLIVVRCAEMARGPIPTNPFPRNATISKYGENVTFSCTGFFGCGQSDFRIVYWCVRDKNNKCVKSPRYVKSNYSRNYDSTIIGSDLTVYDVRPVDLQRQFICELSSPQIFHGTHKTLARIFKKEPPVKVPIWKYVTVTAAGVVSLVCLVILAVAGVNKCYGPRVRWYLNSHLPSCTPLPERGDMEHNALLYHADDDTQKAHDVREKLRERGFDIFISHDISGNRFLGEYEGIVKKCLKIIFLYSENLRCDNFAHFLLQSLIISRRDGDIIFLVLDDFLPQNVKESTDAAENPDKESSGAVVNPDQQNQINDFQQVSDNGEPGNVHLLQGQNQTIDPINGDTLNGFSRNINDAANRGDVEQDGEADAGIYKSKDLSFWRSLPRWNIPKEDASDRQIKNFICWLQNRIPKFAEQVEEEKKMKKRSQINRKRKTSSGRSLLHSQTDEGLMTPNSPRDTVNENVFDDQNISDNIIPHVEQQQANNIVSSIENVDETHVKDVNPNSMYTENGNDVFFYHRLISEMQNIHEHNQDNGDVSMQSGAFKKSLINTADNFAECTNTGDDRDTIDSINSVVNASGSSRTSEFMPFQRSTLNSRVKLDPLSMPERYSSGESGYGASLEKSLSPGINEVFKQKTCMGNRGNDEYNGNVAKSALPY